MTKSFKEVLKITNKNIVLATPLILFSLLSTLYMAISASSKVINLCFGLILSFFMLGAFLAGWLQMVKSAVLEPEYGKNDIGTISKDFASGVGEYFLPAIGAIANIIFISLAMLIVFSIFGIKFIGNPGISAAALSKALETREALTIFVSSLSTEQLVKINLWNFLLLGGMALSYFLMILYLPTMFFKTKNPYLAFFIALKNLFSKKFFKTLGLFVLIFIVYTFVSLVTALVYNNVVLHFIMTLIYFYYIVIAVVGVFYYYYHSFVNIDTLV